MLLCSLALSVSGCFQWPAPCPTGTPLPGGAALGDATGVDGVQFVGQDVSTWTLDTGPGTTPIGGGADVASTPVDTAAPPAVDVATGGNDTAADPPGNPGTGKTGGAPYEHASEAVHSLTQQFSLTGHYGAAMAGGHLVASDASGGSGFPRATPLSSSGTIDIPAGATVKVALLWYGGAVFLKPGEGGGQGDYTPDTGGTLDTLADVQADGITFTLNGAKQGPFDTSKRLAPSPSSLGSATQVSPVEYAPHFGTWTGVRETVWANRIDVTGLFGGKSGAVAVTVNPPERLDLNGNDATKNGGNPAGQTTYNLCSGGASWTMLVVYEKADLPVKNLVLMDGAWARAWDYLFFHSGQWQRPKVRIDHAPLQSGAKLYLGAGSGTPAGEVLPNNPTCTCGCAGIYTLENQGFYFHDYFSDSYVDPPECTSDPMHRDKTNGPWYLNTGGLMKPIAGNDWTLFQSGALYTEFPNLYEGHKAPQADGKQAKTDENDKNAAHDVYDGHPWAGRGQVTYHGHGNALSVVEVALDDAAINAGETTSYLYLKGDQKDVWKPQQIVSVKWALLETPATP